MALGSHYEIHQTTVISVDQKQKLLNALLNCFTLLNLGILKHDIFLLPCEVNDYVGFLVDDLSKGEGRDVNPNLESFP